MIVTSHKHTWKRKTILIVEAVVISFVVIDCLELEYPVNTVIILTNPSAFKPLSMVHIDICVWASNNDVLHNVMQPIVRRITWQIGSDKRGVDHKSQVYIYSVLTFPYWHSLSRLSWPLLFAFNKDLTSRPVLDCAQMLYKIGYWFQFFKSCCISAELNRA